MALILLGFMDLIKDVRNSKKIKNGNPEGTTKCSHAKTKR